MKNIIYRLGFLGLGAIDMLGWMIPYCGAGDGPVPYKMFSGILDLSH